LGYYVKRGVGRKRTEKERGWDKRERGRAGGFISTVIPFLCSHRIVVCWGVCQSANLVRGEIVTGAAGKIGKGGGRGDRSRLRTLWVLLMFPDGAWQKSSIHARRGGGEEGVDSNRSSPQIGALRIGTASGAR